jgi:glucose/arabinose dehydrogenase
MAQRTSWAPGVVNPVGTQRCAARSLIAAAATVALIVASCASGEDGSGSIGQIADPEADGATTPTSVSEETEATGVDGASDDPGAETTATTATTATTTTTTVPAAPPPASQLEGLRLEIELVADLREPTGMAWRAGDDGAYITIQSGKVYRMVEGELTEVLDISNESTVVEPGSERGLLGIDFDPRDGRMFLNFTGRGNDNHTRVISFEVASDGTVQRESRREVMFIEQPGVGHNGGRLVFDSKGHLFIGSGDGGGSNGRDAQDPTKLLGAILRVLPNTSGNGYDIPEDNPFADGVEDSPEVWVRGLRNPWGFSLDEPTGDLWIGDVGNDKLEEINIAPAGQGGFNYGWYFFEGTNQRFAEVPEGLTPPVHEYPRSDGVAVMGGYVYRGSEIPQLEGAYVFGDLTGPVWAIAENSQVVRLEVDPVRALVGWAEDPDGELYLLSLYGGVYRLLPG